MLKYIIYNSKEEYNSSAGITPDREKTLQNSVKLTKPYTNTIN